MCPPHSDLTYAAHCAQVKAFQTFSTHGPQKYALAVLGKFSGILASPGNPANGGTAPPGTCHIVVTTITGGPQGLINQRCAAYFISLDTPGKHLYLSCIDPKGVR